MSLGGGQNTEGSNAGGIFVQFNQDCTSLVAGSSSGYHLFALTPDDGIEEIYASRSGQDTCLVDRLFSSSLVAIVTVSAPRKLIVCHYKKGTEICNYSYSNTILAVKLNRSRLIVCLEESLHIHNIRDMKILHTIRDTPPNPRGLCALSPCVDHCYVAYPGSSAVGEVQIFDAVHLNAKCVISAHDSPLAALAWSMCGRRLATASERGTVIRVFSVPERQRLHEFRRGVKRCVTIACLAFSACGAYLAATSNTETVHVFRLQMLCSLAGGRGRRGGRRGGGRGRRGRAGGAGGLDGMDLAGGVGGRDVPAGAGGGRAGAGPCARRRAPARRRTPRRRRHHQRVAVAAAAGGDGGGRAVRVRAGRGRRRRLRAAAHAPVPRAAARDARDTRDTCCTRGTRDTRACPAARRSGGGQQLRGRAARTGPHADDRYSHLPHQPPPPLPPPDHARLPHAHTARARQPMGDMGPNVAVHA